VEVIKRGRLFGYGREGQSQTPLPELRKS
jgi:hypothetical protein